MVVATRRPYRRRPQGSSKKKVGIRHYNLAMPEGLFEAVEKLADELDTSVADVFRQFAKFGLTIDVMLRDPNVSLIIRDREGETRILWMWNTYPASVSPSDQSKFPKKEEKYER